MLSSDDETQANFYYDFYLIPINLCKIACSDLTRLILTLRVVINLRISSEKEKNHHANINCVSYSRNLSAAFCKYLDRKK